MNDEIAKELLFHAAQITYVEKECSECMKVKE